MIDLDEAERLAAALRLGEAGSAEALVFVHDFLPAACAELRRLYAIEAAAKAFCDGREKIPYEGYTKLNALIEALPSQPARREP